MHYTSGIPIDERRERLHAYIKKHPKTPKRRIQYKGFHGDINTLYDGRINAARSGAGDEQQYVHRSAEEHKQNVKDYLLKHPKATIMRLIEAGLESSLVLGYKNRINDARRDAGLPLKNKKENKEIRSQRLLKFLYDHPDMTSRKLELTRYNSDLMIVYKGKFRQAVSEARALFSDQAA